MKPFFSIISFVFSAFALLSIHAPTLAAGSSKSGSTASASSRTSTPGRQYDSQGRYVGRVDNDGRRYDTQGRFVGRMDAQSGRQYDSQGRYLGRIETNGRQYDSQGKYLGRVEGNGRLYDDNGRYTGRIDADGRQYDAQGRYTGRLDAVAASKAHIATTNPVNNSNTPKNATAALAIQPIITTVEGNRAIAPFVFCNHGDKDCGN